MEKKTFVNGMSVAIPSENAPSFVKMKVSFKVADFAAFLSEHENNNGWVNIDILESKDGTKLYGALNDFKPQKPKVLEEQEVDDSASPF